MRGSYVASAVVLIACGGSPSRDIANTGGGEPAASKPFAVTEMVGPYATVADLCTGAIAAAGADSADEEVSCWEIGSNEDEPMLMPGADLPAGPQGLAAPFRSARFVAVGGMGPACHIAVELDDGRWYGAELGMCGAEDSRSSMYLSLIDLAVTDLFPGGAPELRVRYRDVTRLSNLDNDGVNSETETEWHLICGIGSSGRPSCLELDVKGRWSVELLTEGELDPEMAADRPAPGSGSWERTVEYRADAIVIGGTAPPDGDAEARAGRHPIAFP